MTCQGHWLSRGFIAVKRSHDQGNSYKGKHLTGAALQFRGSVHYHHDGKYGSMQADMVLEKELRVVHLDPKAARRKLTSADSQEEALFGTLSTEPQSPPR